MTPNRLIAIFKEIAENQGCIFFAGITREFLRTAVEREDSEGKTFVVIDLQGMSVKEDFNTRKAEYQFTLHVIKRDNPDSVSQETDNQAEYPAIQTICLDCYNQWIDVLNTLRADYSGNADYLDTYYQELTISNSDATYFIKPKLLGMMSGIFVNVKAEGKISC